MLSKFSKESYLKKKVNAVNQKPGNNGCSNKTPELPLPLNRSPKF